MKEVAYAAAKASWPQYCLIILYFNKLLNKINYFIKYKITEENNSNNNY